MASAGEPKRLYDRQLAAREKSLRAGAKSASSDASWREGLLQFLRSRL